MKTIKVSKKTTLLAKGSLGRERCLHRRRLKSDPATKDYFINGKKNEK